jgi:chromosome segregation ATPase
VEQWFTPPSIVAMIGSLVAAYVAYRKATSDGRRNQVEEHDVLMARYHEFCDGLELQIDKLSVRIEANDRLIAELQAQLEESRVENAQLRAEMARLRAENAELRVELAALKAQQCREVTDAQS